MGSTNDPHVLVAAEQLATNAIYSLRQGLVHASPELRLLAAKALLGKVRTMVEDLEQAMVKTPLDRGRNPRG